MKILRQKTIPARLEHLKESLELISSCARDQGFNQKKALEIELAAEEALVNIFTYAYKGKEGDVEIACKLDNDKFIIEIADSGEPYDVLSVADPDIRADITERQPGGLGVFLMKELMDDVRYAYKGNRNILRLIALKGPGGG
ncbi:MAG: ATP-binding protein [Nitrospiraceae bacterium]|nr:ATP-binding protein [Nitrospiraceae bacterium]